jgi:hypothetical protein
LFWRSIYWLIRKPIAEKNKDYVMCSCTNSREISCPFVLRLWGLKLFEMTFVSQNTMSFSGSRWIIVDKRGIPSVLNHGILIPALRIQGDDRNPAKPMVVWRKYD